MDVRAALVDRVRRGCAGGEPATRERGATAVEAALVLPILLLIVVGIIEFGFAFKDQLAVTSAVRAGARMASAEPRVTTYATDAAGQVAEAAAGLDLQDGDQLWVYRATAAGYPESAGSGFGSCTAHCVVFSWSSSGHTFVEQSDSWPATLQNACPGTQDSVGVYLRTTHHAVTSAIFSTLGLASWTVMRLEPVAGVQGGC